MRLKHAASIFYVHFSLRKGCKQLMVVSQLIMLCGYYFLYLNIAIE